MVQDRSVAGFNSLFSIRCDTSLTHRRGNSNQEVLQLALQDIIEAQEIGQDDDDLRLSSEGWTRFQALMAQADESIKAGKA
jgi:hypothetical protein